MQRTHVLIGSLLLTLVAFCGQSCARESAYKYVKDDYQFTSSPTPMDDVAKGLDEAKMNNRLLVVVLGAQWCHDSRGLGGRFSTPEMQAVLVENYETVFIDVGYLEDRRAITQRFGHPTYFATPTVMVIDPNTEQLLNGDTMDKWAFADSVALNDYVDYFTAFKKADDSSAEATTDFPALREFFYLQANRLQQAYSQLGPMLEKDENGSTPVGFLDMWRETRGFRMSLQSDWIELQKAPASDLNALPTYGPFSWESE